MHLVFLDGIEWAYQIDTPFHQPMGGTQSAVCYLMLELAARGHRISFINRAAPHEYKGVRAISMDFQKDAILDADYVIMVGSPYEENISQLKPYCPNAKNILWQHHAADQPMAEGMNDPVHLKYWDHAVFVSEWQKQQYLANFVNVSSIPCHVIGNAISPPFQNLFADLPIGSLKFPTPLLSYSSTPYRGLDRLLYAWKFIYPEHHDTQLQIFSSMKVYNPDNPEYRAEILEQAKIMPGVAHVGTVPQSELAHALRASWMLAYPNTFEETACIAAMEAMAAGCLILTSDMGALPETLAGYGEFVSFHDDAVTHATHFAHRANELIAQMKNNREAFFERMTDQVRFANQTYSWAQRAKEWEALLTAAN